LLIADDSGLFSMNRSASNKLANNTANAAILSDISIIGCPILTHWLVLQFI
jgi:hypothetical protein